MRKLTLALFAILMMAAGAQAQHVFNKGDIGVNAGIGIGGYGGLVPSIEASVEVGVIPTGDIGLVSFGGVAGWKYSYYNYDYAWFDGDNFNYQQFVVGGRASWHLHTFDSDKWDVYAGLGLGVKIWTEYDYDWDYNHGYTTTNEARAGLYEEFFVGGRMMMNEGFGLFAEVGYRRLSNVRFGLTFKM